MPRLSLSLFCVQSTSAAAAFLQSAVTIATFRHERRIDIGLISVIATACNTKKASE